MQQIDLSKFSAISLNQLNAQASLMDRDEEKYIIHQKNLPALLESLAEDFSVLKIQDNSIFSYDNIYMDTKDLDFYYDHNAGKKSRIKVRTRHYIDSEMFFFEFKQKLNGHMRKFRYAIDEKKHGVMDKVGYSFIEDVYYSLFEEKMKRLVFPSIGTSYKRITLCHKTKAEKITIDFNLMVEEKRLTDTSAPIARIALDNTVIIESKTNETESIGQKILAENAAQQVGTCSKYCIGLNALGKVHDNKHFAKTLELVESIMAGGPSFSKKKLLKKITRAI